jgi:hypothetical protein
MMPPADDTPLWFNPATGGGLIARPVAARQEGDEVVLELAFYLAQRKRGRPSKQAQRGGGEGIWDQAGDVGRRANL